MLKTPTHLAYVATLPCETLLSAKQAINDKLQGSVAAYLRCGGLFTNQNKKGLFMNLEVTSTFFICQQSVGQVHKVHEITTFLLATLPNIHHLKFFFHSHTQQ